METLTQLGEHVVEDEDGGLQVCALAEDRLTHMQPQLVPRQCVQDLRGRERQHMGEEEEEEEKEVEEKEEEEELTW